MILGIVPLEQLRPSDFSTSKLQQTAAMADHQEQVTDTWVTSPGRLVSTRRTAACVVHIYPTGPGMGTRYELIEKPVVLGRGTDCDIRINDHSVSRTHARIQPGTDGHYAVDLQSTNGTYVNDNLISIRKLRDGDYVRIGNCIYRYLAGGNVEAEYHEEIYRLTIFDALTEIHNKRYLIEFLDRELARSARYSRPLSLLLLDLDHFRNVNYKHGHLGGDYVLRELSACIKSTIRKEELFARYGGEEFAVVLPETTLDGALRTAERLRAKTEGYKFEYEGEDIPITISVGVACTAGDESLTPRELVQRADGQLYCAKDDGRNCVRG